MRVKTLKEYMVILLAGILYAFSTHFYIFPFGLFLGGTSGISVILYHFMPFAPGIILMMINIVLLALAFLLLGKDMAIKTFIGSLVTTVAIGGLEILFPSPTPMIPNIYISGIVGAILISAASASLFYVRSSSGGTDIAALIVNKYTKMNIGKALLYTDILIVVVGGILSGFSVAAASVTGLLIKTFGIDWIIAFVQKHFSKETPQNS
ncbi:MAG: YitT family protein [Oscillospiraceae bacterium]|nr:YitT family protein [Oscillospiraceae bacterium]